ncbi:MAG: sialate O-acetylesterase [Bacteroidota bacterium]
MKHSLKFFLSLFLLALLSCKNHTQDAKFHIYLCFGQSNMEGQGKIEPQDTIVDKRFQVFQTINCANKGFIIDQWRAATPPLCQCNSGAFPF